MVSREERLSSTFVTLADTLVGSFDLNDLLHTLSSTCVELLDADAAGILLAEPGGSLRVVAASDDTLRVLELFELQGDQGPCLDCLETGDQVVGTDLRRETRWPAFTPRALEAGYLSVDAVPMRLRSERVGALNLFRTSEGALSASDRGLAQALADVAAIGLIQARLVAESHLLATQLQHALNSRVTIEQAKGMIAEQGGIEISAAFLLLRDAARRTSTGISEVAGSVLRGDIDHDTIATGALDTD